MKSKRMIFLILLLFLVLIPSTRASRYLAFGSLGLLLSYVIDSPTELKVGEDTPVNFKFVHGGAGTAFVKSIWVAIWGAGINSTETGITKLLVKDIELSTFDSVNETILVKPLKEGTVAYMVSAEYNWTDSYGNPRNDWGNDKVYIHARMNTHSELVDSENIFRNLTYLLTTTTIAFMATTVYLLKKRNKLRTGTSPFH